MEATTQPILCCVGETVAGRPTQFLMERALASAELDWRVLTVEVEPDEFAAALQGMLAMKFRALRFFAAYQQQALEHFGSDDPWLRFVGAISSAHRGDDGYECWYHGGPALLKRLDGQRINWSEAICWIQGNDALHRSLLAASESAPPRRIVWSDSPEEVPGELLSALPLERPATDEEAYQAVSEAIGEAEDQSPLVLSGQSWEMLLPTVAKLCGERMPTVLIANPSLTARDIRRAHPAPPPIVLSLSEQLLAGEAYDFERWTGQPADEGLMRDALDEYSDF